MVSDTETPTHCISLRRVVLLESSAFIVYCAKSRDHAGKHRGMTELYDATGKWFTTVKVVWE